MKSTLSTLIDELIVEGKSDADVATAVLEHEDAKSMDAAEVADIISAQKKAVEVATALAKKAKADADAKAQKEAKTAQEKQVEKLVDEKLKSINIDPKGTFRAKESFKRFDTRTGKIEEYTHTDGEKAFHNMLNAIADRDTASAKSISREIDQDNFRLAGKATPTVSDVDARGGYAIPTEVSNQIQQLIYSGSVMIPLMNQDNIIVEDKIYPLMYGMSVGYIANQSTTITEKNPTITNPTVAMERVGGFSTVSNTILRQKGADLTAAFVSAYGSEFAKFFDLHITCGNVTGASDLIDGIVFDANTSTPTAVALSSLTIDTLKDVKNTLDASADLSSTAFIANRKVADTIGLLENTGGAFAFPGYVEGRQVAPFGIPLVVNSQIGSDLDVSGDNRTGGGNDVLICADLSKVVLGMSAETRIDTSQDFLFTDDLLTLRAVKSWGQKVLSGSSTAGVVAVAQELTN